jgi:hypothetical protein
MKTAQGWVLTLWVILLGAPNAYSGDNDFASFFAKFKAAVEHQDEKALTAMMASPFAFIRAENVSPADVFRSLNADGGLQWQNLQKTVQGQPVDYNAGKSAPGAKVLKCIPTEPIYTCLVIFTPDSKLGWRWKGMIMPPV